MKTLFSHVFSFAALLAVSQAAETYLIDEDAIADYIVPTVDNGGSSLGLDWIAAADPANIANWSQGELGIGYDNNGDYDGLIDTDVDAGMNGSATTIYLRLKFQIADTAQLDAVKSLLLNVRSDDGFIAYLNGVRVADRQAPANPDWDSQATGGLPDLEASRLAAFEISQHIQSLLVGDNVLALHGMNDDLISSDFLISAQLVADDTESQSPPELRLVPVTTGLSRPVDVQHAGDGTGRVFVVEKPGRVRIVLEDDTLLSTPFLDIETLVDDGGNEEGLLGLAFPPDFANKQYFYVYYNGVAEDPVNFASDSYISRFYVSAGDPNVADESFEEVILRVPQPFSNHNGGQIDFSPFDGFLYIGFGDGGSGNDPGDRSQNPATLLGKMVRIDVEGTPDPGKEYAVPASNPFVGSMATLDEIWAFGLRNPYRFGFDRLTGDMYIGDVGQNAIEEIDFEPAGSPGGVNYGWRYWEGTRQNVTTGRVPTSPVFPAFEYSQSIGGRSVISGYVYRGKQFPRMAGTYFYADYTGREVRGLTRNGQGVWFSQDFVSTGFSPTSFGENEEGNLYMTADTGTGSFGVYRLQDSQDANYLQNISYAKTLDGRPIVEVGVAVGESYQLQVSDDLVTWTDVGDPVVASGFSLEFELPLANFAPPRQFLRVAELE